MPEASTVRVRLDSWKKIASYLDRDIRTVMRWEQEKELPIHRVPGGKRQAIFAYTDEIDAWLLGQTGKGDTESLIAEEKRSIPTPLSSESTIRRKTRLVAVTICVLVVALAVTIGVAFRRPVTLRIAHLDKLTTDGQAKSNLRSYGTHLYFNQFEAGREILVTSSLRDGAIHPIDTPFANVDLQDISNDGQTLLVTSFEGTVEKGERPLWTMPVRGGSPRRLGESFCDVARWSPDNRRIACVSGASVFVLDENGTNPRTAGSFSSVPVRLLWSPDNDKLRIVLWDVNAGTKTPWELPVSNREAITITSPTRLPLGKNCCTGWTWTRDGNAFLYTKLNQQGHGVLFTRPEGESSPQEAELPVTDAGELAQGGKDQQFYLLIGAAYRGQLFKFDPRSKEFQRFLPNLSASYLSFSRDGKWMTYINLADKSLWRSHVNGSDAVQLTKPPMDTEFSAWSPDGREIAFMGKLPGKPWRIFLVNPDGSAMREAAQGDDNQGAPTWSADGSALVYGNISCEPTHSCWIRRIDLASKREELLSNSNGFRTARWSPDGKYILALQPRLHQLMLFDVKTEHWKVLVGGIMGDSPSWSADSRSIYVDTLKEKTPIIERVQVSNGDQNTVAELTSFQKSPGQLDYWIGLAPDSTPILLHQFAPVDVYAVEWTTK